MQAIHSPGDEAYTLDRTRLCLKLYYDPAMSDFDRAEMIDAYGKALATFPKWAVAQAFDTWQRNGTRRPSPGDLVILANRACEPITDELARRRKDEDEARIARQSLEAAKPSKEAAAEILARAGFTPRRTEAVQRKRMARSEAELYEGGIHSRVPHWTEGAAADSAAMDALRKSRAANPLMAEAMADAKRFGGDA